MAGRSSNPVGTFFFFLVIAGSLGFWLVRSNLVSGVWVFFLFIFVSLIFLVLLFALGGFRIVDQFERGVVLTLGKYTATKQPGFRWIMPGFQRMFKIDMRIVTETIPQQEAITQDNVPVGINAVVYFRVESAEKAFLEIENFHRAVKEYAQGALRDVIGGIELDALLAERKKIAEEIKKNVDEATKEWGVNVTDIKIQDIELPADMKRVMAKQAESERERRAVIIKAEGEFAAAKRLSEAAEVLSSSPGGVAMRTLQTIEKINPDPSKTVIFAIPIEFFEGIKALSTYLKEKVK